MLDTLKGISIAPAADSLTSEQPLRSMIQRGGWDKEGKDTIVKPNSWLPSGSPALPWFHVAMEWKLQK